MQDVIRIDLPLNDERVKTLKIGDRVLLSGVIYTARDAAHKRIIDTINRGEKPPFDIKNQTIYYVGASPAREGRVIGSAGPTTSYRMDDLTLPLLQRGLKGMIGKGERESKVVEGMKQHCAVYFAAIGGAGALISNSIKSRTLIAYEDLMAEAVYKLEVVDFPAIVVIDCNGNNLYKTEKLKYRL